MKNGNWMLVKSEVKYIQNLSHKKFREETGLFIAEGPKIINELLAGRQIMLHHLYATANWFDQFPRIAAELPTSLYTQIKEQDLERISMLATPQLALGLFHIPAPPEKSGTAKGIRLVLDGIQDPGNVGTIIRCADWFGVSDIICSESSADAFSPKVVQASMGSIARVRIRYTSLEEYIRQYPDWPVYTAELTGQPVASVGKIAKGFLVIGNESKGIHPSLLAAIRHTSVTIPRKGKAESLNAAVAAAILLSHLT